MTKFLTAVLRVLPFVLSAVSASALPAACPLLFTELSPAQFSVGAQTSFINDQKIQRTENGATMRLLISPNADARVRRAIEHLRQDLRLRFEHTLTIENGKAVEQDAFLPLPVEAVVQIPARALATNESLAAFLEALLPVTKQYVYQRDREANFRVTSQFSPKAKALLDAVFEKNRIRVFTKEIPNLGLSDGRTITIDKSYAKRARAIGTVAHEIYHTTVTRKLSRNASEIDVGRAIWFRLKEAKVSNAYKQEFRADEFEARLRQIGSLKRNGFKTDVPLVEKSAALFLIEQLEVCEIIVAFFDEALVEIKDTSQYATARSIEVSLAGDTIYVPLVREIQDVRAYAKLVLEKRVEILRAK